jgi:hypothetical protein
LNKLQWDEEIKKTVGMDRITGYSSQLHLILQPFYVKPKSRQGGISPPPQESLAYVQHFSYSHLTLQRHSQTAIPVVNNALNMYEVHCSNPHAGGIPKGDTTFYVNSFCDSQIYQTVY